MLPLSFVRRHRGAVIVNEGYCKGLEGYYPACALNDNEGLTRFAQLAYGPHTHTGCLPGLAGDTQFHELNLTLLTTKRPPIRENIAVKSRLELFIFPSPC